VQQHPAVPDHDSERAFAIMADEDIPERVAALEQIVRNDIRADLRAIRSRMRWVLAAIIVVLLIQAALWLQVGIIAGG
jgi:hypothetical protein